MLLTMFLYCGNANKVIYKKTLKVDLTPFGKELFIYTR